MKRKAKIKARKRPIANKMMKKRVENKAQTWVTNPKRPDDMQEVTLPRGEKNHGD